MEPIIAITITADALAVAFSNGEVSLSGSFAADAFDSLLAQTDDILSSAGGHRVILCGEANAISAAIEAGLRNRGLVPIRLGGEPLVNAVEQFRKHEVCVGLPGPSVPYADLGVAEAQAVAAVELAGYLPAWCAEQLTAARPQR